MTNYTGNELPQNDSYSHSCPTIPALFPLIIVEFGAGVGRFRTSLVGAARALGVRSVNV